MLNNFFKTKIRELSQNPRTEVGKLILERSEPHTSQTSQGGVCKGSALLLCGVDTAVWMQCGGLYASQTCVKEVATLWQLWAEMY